MSELDKNKSMDFSKFDSMSSEELWSIVDDEFYSQRNDESSAEMILSIMEVLEKRGELLKPKKDISEIWRNEEPEKVTELPKRNTGRKLRRLAVSFAAAIALLMALAVTANAMGGYDLFGVIGTWTDEKFRLKSVGGTPQSAVQNTKDIPDELREYAELLDENGFDSNVLLPGYLPEGYEIIKVNVVDMDSYKSYFCALQNGDSYIVIDISDYFDDKYTAVHEKDAGDPEEYIYNNITHYIMTNFDTYLAVWVNGNLQYSIYGFSTEEELISTINSIYG